MPSYVKRTGSHLVPMSRHMVNHKYSKLGTRLAHESVGQPTHVKFRNFLKKSHKKRRIQRRPLDTPPNSVIHNLMVKYSTSLDTTFSALSDPTRRTILLTLQRGNASVTELARPHDISMPAILKHLHVLEQAGLIEQKKTGRVRMCRLTVAPMQQAADWLSLYRVFWENQLDALGRFLERTDPKKQENKVCRKPPLHLRHRS
jgi:DNA-binding transcriptional ArsR family regulator